MFNLFSSGSACVHSLSDAPLGMLPLQGPDSPFGNLLGYIVVFFVVVWPIIRGLLDNAKKQRAEFEAKETKAGHRPNQSRNRQARRTLEEILEGKLERVDSYDEPEPTYEEKPTAVTPRRERTPLAQAKKPKAPALGDRPADESVAPVYHLDDLHGESDVELGGDPFDEGSMESDLVSESKLSHVPTEDELESNLDSTMRGISRGAASARPGPGGLTPAYVPDLGALRSEDPEAIFRGMGRPLTPWQKAFILKEVLGQPMASRPAPTLTDLPS